MTRQVTPWQQKVAVSDSRRPDIQGLRAVAVLVVVAYHAGLPVPGGFIGVDVFFVISGFVITAMLQREWARSGRVDFRNFYWRRFWRLTPALALVSTVTLVASAILLSPLGPQEVVAETAIGAMALSANFVIARNTGGYFDAPADLNPLLNTWSLSVEEQFYIVFPILLIGALALARGRARVPVVMISSVTLLSLGVTLLTSRGFSFDGPIQYLVGFYGPLTRAWEFGVGALLVFMQRRAVGRVAADGAACLGIVMILASLWIITPSTPGPGVRNLIPVVGTALIIWRGQRPTFVGRLLSRPGPVALGDLSYSWYLWHWPVIVFAAVVWPNNGSVLLAAALFSAVPAVISFRWVEQPLRRVRIINRKSRLAASGIFLLPIVSGLALLVANNYGFWNEPVRALQGAASKSAGFEAGCVGASSLQFFASSRPECTWGEARAGMPIYLIGDSLADQLSDGLLVSAQELNRPVREVVLGSCPFVRDVVSTGGRFQSADCREFVQGVLRSLDGEPAGTVIISMSPKYWIEAESTEALKVNPLGSELGEIAEEIMRSGHEVLFVRPTPVWINDYAFVPERCSLRAIWDEKCQQSVAQVTAERDQSLIWEAMRLAAVQSGASVWNSWDHVCAGGICATHDGVDVNYRDETHISVIQSLKLAEALSGVIQSDHG